MEKLIIYWVIGCVVVGIPAGRIIAECPQAKFEAATALAQTAIWPLVLVAAIAMGKTDRPVCEHPSPAQSER